MKKAEINLFTKSRLPHSKGKFDKSFVSTNAFSTVARTRPISEDEPDKKGVYKKSKYSADVLVVKFGDTPIIFDATGKIVMG